MILIRLIVVLLLTVFVAACGGNKDDSDFFAVEKPEKKPKVDNLTRLSRVWKVNLGGDVDNSDLALSPALRGDHIYAAATNGRVYKIATDNGKKQWVSKLDTKISAGVGVGSGLVMVGSDKGVIYAIEQDSGSLAWQKQLSSEILATPVAENNIVVVRSVDGKLYGLSALNGDILWTISRQLPKLTLRGDSTPLIYKGVVFAGFSDGTLAALQLENGRALWDLPVSFPRGSSDIDRLSDVDSNPLLVGDFIYITSYQEVTHALDTKQRKIAWSTDLSSFKPLDYDAAYLYLSDRQGVVYQIDRLTGAKTWSQSALRLRNIGGPISVGPFVLVSDNQSELFVIEKRNGNIVGRHKLGAKGIVGESVSNADTVYFIDTNGDLQAISILNKKR